MSRERASGVMRVFSSSGRILSVFVIFMSKNLSTNCYHRIWRVDVNYQGEINLSSNYYTFANLLSFLGIEEEAALVIKGEI